MLCILHLLFKSVFRYKIRKSAADKKASTDRTMMPDKWIGAFPALIADIALRAIPVKRRFEIFSKMLLNPDNIGTIINIMSAGVVIVLADTWVLA